MSWTHDTILFGQAEGVARVSAKGGQPEGLIAVKDGSVWNPQMLPDGRSVLYTLVKSSGAVVAGLAAGDSWDNAKIMVHPLNGGDPQPLVEGADGRYLPTGHVVFARGATLFAAPFDDALDALTAGAAPVVEGVRRSPTSGAVYFSVSDNGSLIYASGLSTAAAATRLVLVDRNGAVEPLPLRPASYGFPRVSPDGKWIAVDIDDGKDANVWVYELSGASSMRQVTFGGKNRYPIWAADSQRIAFQSDREGDPAIFSQRADGSGAADRLTRPERGTVHVPESWSRDGARFLYSVINGERLSLWAYSIADQKAAAVGSVQSTYTLAAMFSPDGRWIVYNGGTSGADRAIFVESFPRTETKYRIARGVQPVWSPDGRELLFRSGEVPLQTVHVTGQSALQFSNSEAVPAGAGLTSVLRPLLHRQYDIMPPEGKRFVAVAAGTENQDGKEGSQIQVVLNWTEELKQRVPTRLK